MMRWLFLPLILVACSDAPQEPSAEATTPKTPANESKAEPDASVAHPKARLVSTSDAWGVPGDGIPEMDESNATTLASGLTIITSTLGTGPKPIRGQKIKVHYHGWLADGGKMFDSSGKSGKPLSFAVGTGRVIKGWDEGLLALTQGSKARFRIPAALGYGSSGAGRVIPADADLVFDVWLIGLAD
jgi:peptidylprolyl isomerase